jgi:TPP-dependent pyruvate/acetoin dehydrogenase alpha subunit
MYRVMVRIRTFEDRVIKEFAAGKIPGAAHLYAGEEAARDVSGETIHFISPNR